MLLAVADADADCFPFTLAHTDINTQSRIDFPLTL